MLQNNHLCLRQHYESASLFKTEKNMETVIWLNEVLRQYVVPWQNASTCRY